MNIIMDDIPYELHTMVEIVGMDKFLEISKMYGGGNVYIPVYRKVIMGHRNREIARAYNGKNIKELKYRYNMSTQHVKGVLKKEGLI